MYSMFSGCSSLEYINLYNFREMNSVDAIQFFQNIPDNVVVCINENNNRIINELKTKSLYTIDCSSNWKINQKRIINKTDICWDNSNNNILYKYEYKGLYYENCINGNLINNSTINHCNCDNDLNVIMVIMKKKMIMIIHMDIRDVIKNQLDII